MTSQLDELIDEFFLARMPKKHSANTLAAYRRDFDAIRATLSDVLGVPAAEITIEQLDVRTLRRAFAGIAHQAASTISRTWSTWNQLFTFLVAEQIIPGNPMAAINKPRVPKGRPKAIVGDDSVGRLLQLAAEGRRGARDPWPERDFAIIVTLLTCGLRLSELLSLTIQSIDGPQGERVIGVRGKGNKERTVPLEPEVESIIVDYLEARIATLPRKDSLGPQRCSSTIGASRYGGAACSTWSSSCIARPASGAAFPSGALVHALRHTFATSLARNGASGVELQRLLGHESIGGPPSATSTRPLGRCALRRVPTTRTKRWRRSTTTVDGEGVACFRR